MKYAYLVLLMAIIAGCTTTEISTNNSVDGDLTENSEEESDGDTSEEDSAEEAEESDGDSVDGDSTEETDGDSVDGDSTEETEEDPDGDSTEEDTEETEWCHDAPASCEDIQGTCPEGQACRDSSVYGSICYYWDERWLTENMDSCTNDKRECGEGDFCCEQKSGFWYPAGYVIRNEGGLYIWCDENHEMHKDVQDGWCWLDLNNDNVLGEGDEIYEDHEFMDDSNCTYCNPEISQTSATNVPAGESCTYISDGHSKIGMCDGDGNCIPKY